MIRLGFELVGDVALTLLYCMIVDSPSYAQRPLTPRDGDTLHTHLKLDFTFIFIVLSPF